MSFSVGNASWEPSILIMMTRKLMSELFSLNMAQMDRKTTRHEHLTTSKMLTTPINRRKGRVGPRVVLIRWFRHSFVFATKDAQETTGPEVRVTPPVRDCRPFAHYPTFPYITRVQLWVETSALLKHTLYMYKQ